MTRVSSATTTLELCMSKMNEVEVKKQAMLTRRLRSHGKDGP